MYQDYEKTVRIPVIINNGKVRYYYGGDLPEIGNNVIGELILPEHSVKDERFVSISQMEEEIEFIAAGNTLMFSVSKKSVPQDKEEYLKIIPTQTWTSDAFVEVSIKEPLKLLIRGSKKPILSNVKCFIPSLGKEVISLNSAYSAISEIYESHRTSHTGNVFDKCYYKHDNLWYTLDHKRQIEEGKFEEKLFLDYKIFKINEKTSLANFKLENSEDLLVRYLYEFQTITGEKVKQLFNNDKQKYIHVINSLIDKEIIQEIKK